MDVHGIHRVALMLVVISGISFVSGSEKQNIDRKAENNSELQPKDIVFIVLSQKNPYHEKRAEVFKEDFDAQVQELSERAKPKLIFIHKKHRSVLGAWTVFPLLQTFAEEYADASWLFVCEEETRVDVHKLVKVLQRFDHTKELYLGHPLRDQSPTIIHHYAFHENPSKFAYADWGAGFVLSQSLLAKTGKRWPDKDYKIDFTIDPKHELAKYMYSDAINVTLTPVTELCLVKKSTKCASWYPMKFPDCGPEIPVDDLYIAVKTCAKYHKERISVVKKTWGNDAKNVEYYSDTEDSMIPTINLGIPNTERGHCGKTMAIIKRIQSHPKISHIPWYIIVDDDTIINLRRLRKLLACYNPNFPIHMGEKYGYMVTKNDHGYTYITGGGGMVFSKEAIDVLVLTHRADCPSNDAPDDMILGRTFKAVGLPLVHSPYFHQARPVDYSPEFLSARTAISFHKHWMNDPIQTYQDLIASDESMDTADTEEGETSGAQDSENLKNIDLSHANLKESDVKEEL
ncbi:beta-1,3-glucosyltransferase-like [Argopecten irradians]|uniref:beta-1,3-glucosyltransferase-like n=1 Tax=Argopecten irradians TaxID=31199 RepID=UPI0037127C5F